MDTRRDFRPEPRPSRGKAALVLMLLGLALATAGFGALGVWQLQRLDWKLALIARVNARIHATPTPAPTDWQHISAARDEYRHVYLQGRFLPGHDTRVQAVTALGAGFWVLTPFRTDAGRIVLVNRGFVPPDWPGGLPPPVRQVSGLLRLSEPGGAFLRHNDPATARWYSRDVAAIARAQGLSHVAPYFVDADAVAVGDAAAAAASAAKPAAGDSATLGSPDAAAWPRAGLTVTHFRNSHLSYALTWFALALMSAAAAGYVAWDARRASRPRPPHAREQTPD